MKTGLGYIRIYFYLYKNVLYQLINHCSDNLNGTAMSNHSAMTLFLSTIYMANLRYQQTFFGLIPNIFIRYCSVDRGMPRRRAAPF